VESPVRAGQPHSVDEDLARQRSAELEDVLEVLSGHVVVGCRGLDEVGEDGGERYARVHKALDGGGVGGTGRELVRVEGQGQGLGQGLGLALGFGLERGLGLGLGLSRGLGLGLGRGLRLGQRLGQRLGREMGLSLGLGVRLGKGRRLGLGLGAPTGHGGVVPG
jgi:hypothetical protein